MEKKVTKKELTIEEQLDQAKQELENVKQQLEQKTKEYDALMKQAEEIIKNKNKRIDELVAINQIYINMVQGK